MCAGGSSEGIVPIFLIRELVQGSQCRASLTCSSQRSRSKAESHPHRHEVAVCLADSGLLEVGFGLRKEGMWIVEATAVCFSTSVFFSPNFCN